MKILKFGGTSVGTPQRMKNVAELITKDGKQKIVVLSAMSGTTNTLVEISEYLHKKNPRGANNVINSLESKYKAHIKELYQTEQCYQETANFLERAFDHLRSFTQKSFFPVNEKEILAQGEILSTNMVTNYMREQGVKVMLIPALDFMRINEYDEPDASFIQNKLLHILEKNPGYEIYITQGFICRNHKDEIDNLQRGGSDYTASLIGAALKAEEIQIWTDIDGMHNNDPRIVDKTEAVRQLHFEEAAELAYFGAKILHPTCVLPAKFAGVPVLLLNTMKPEAPGTIINNELRESCIKAVAAKDNITVVRIVSSRMFLATGFLRKVFEVFEAFHTSIDMVTTSEVGVSMSIDNDTHLEEIMGELKKFGTVDIDKDMCIICVVGDLDWQRCVGFESLITEAMKDIPIRMISYGGSYHNISFLIREEDKKAALQALNNHIFHISE